MIVDSLSSPVSPPARAGAEVEGGPEGGAGHSLRPAAICRACGQEAPVTRSRLCRTCKSAERRRQYRKKHGLPVDAPGSLKGRPRVVPGTERTCKACEVTKPIAAFGTWQDKGYTRVRWKCKACEKAMSAAYWDAHIEERRAYERQRGREKRERQRGVCADCGGATSRKGRRCWECANPGRPRNTTSATPKPAAAERKTHPCIGCGVALYEKEKECLPCKRRRQSDQHAGNSAAFRKLAHKRVLRNKHKGIMWVGEGEAADPLAQDYACQKCEKPVLCAGLCYSCAEGRERTVLRPEERKAVAA